MVVEEEEGAEVVRDDDAGLARVDLVVVEEVSGGGIVTTLRAVVGSPMVGIVNIHTQGRVGDVPSRRWVHSARKLRATSRVVRNCVIHVFNDSRVYLGHE